jgi:hypothetical protein
MKYSLKKPENIVIDLPGGGSITARPVTTPVLEAAKAVAERLTREARANPELMGNIGLTGEGDGRDDDIGSGIYKFFLRIELGVRLIESWQDFGDETAAEATPDNIRAAFSLFPMVAGMFFDAVMVRPMLMAAIKNNSAPAATGTSSPPADGATAKAAAS